LFEASTMAMTTTTTQSKPSLPSAAVPSRLARQLSSNSLSTHTPVAIRGAGGMDMSTKGGASTAMPLPRLSLTPARTPARQSSLTDLG
jgi:hypothetical protein